MTYASLGRSLAFVLLVACGGGNKTEDTTTVAKTEVTAEIVLELGELTLFEGDDAIAKIHADGKTEISEGPPGKWQPGPTLKQDGTVEHEGTAVAKVNSDGTVVDLKSNAKLPFTVTSDKLTITEGDKQMAIELGATGSITVIGEDGPKKPVRVDGAKTPGQRKTALAFLALMVGSRNSEPAPKEAVSTPPG